MSEQALPTHGSLIEGTASDVRALFRKWCAEGQGLRKVVSRDVLGTHFGSTRDGRLQAQSVTSDMLEDLQLKPVFVKVDSHTVLQLINPQSDTPGTLFCKLRARGLLGSDDGTMQFGGRVLDFTRSLVSYGITAISTVNFVRRARGGVPMIGQDKLSVCFTSALESSRVTPHTFLSHHMTCAKVDLLKDSCRIFDLPVSGVKDELYERVRERLLLSKIMPELEKYTVEQLKEICRLYELQGFAKLTKNPLVAHIRSGVGMEVPSDENACANPPARSGASSSSTRVAEPSFCMPTPLPAFPPTSKPDANDKLLHGVNFQVGAAPQRTCLPRVLLILSMLRLMQGEELKMLCAYFNLPVSGNKSQQVARLKPVVSAKMVDLLVEHEIADLKVSASSCGCFRNHPQSPHTIERASASACLQMAQLRELANPLHLKAKDAYTLQIGLSHAGIGPNAIVAASDPRSPSGMKPKKPFDFQGVVPPVNPFAPPAAMAAPDAAMKPCRFYCRGSCKNGDSCSFLHTSIKPLKIAESVKRPLLDAASFAYSKYYSKPYLEMPDSYEGDWESYYADWESAFGVERPNHGQASALRKAMLVSPTCDAFGFKPDEKTLIAMMVTMVFEVVGRESEAGYLDCPKTYSRYKSRSVRALQEYASKQPWFNTACVEALESMYYEPRSAEVAKIQQIFETVHELDLFRCYPEDKMRNKVNSIARVIGGKACYELVLRAENQIAATGDRLPFSMMWNRLTDDYNEDLFRRCSMDSSFCLEQIATIPLVPTHVTKKKGTSAPSTSVKPVPSVATVPVPSAAKVSAKRTLRNSTFIRMYTAAELPSFQDELMGPVRKLIAWFAQQNGLDQKLVADYFNRVQERAFKAGKTEIYQKDSIPFIAVRLWTTAERFAGNIEFCSILNKALRDDSAEIMEHVAIIVRAINMQCVSRFSGKHIKWPKSNTTYRGTNMPHSAVMWYTQGKEYRVPMYLATSSDEDTAEGFMREASGVEPVMFIFHFDKVKRCKHVNFIDKTDKTVKGEKEYLFAPYSVFTVRRAEIVKEPRVTFCERIFHIIEVDVAYDNTKSSLDLPLSEWA